jgi:hypothetical protein
MTHYYLRHRFNTPLWGQEGRHEYRVLCTRRWEVQHKAHSDGPSFTTSPTQVSCKPCLEILIKQQAKRLNRMRENYESGFNPPLPEEDPQIELPFENEEINPPKETDVDETVVLPFSSPEERE